ncbi:sucrase ferredoxin [Rhodococcus kronopolitis]|uniref:Sucrase ferredoxin n=1 Tax=Rhodococcus kronopolitis TaxID=1460226 RepID=A0ABV9FLG8_9NOCA
MTSLQTGSAPQPGPVPQTCSALSAVDEPLPGTAAQVTGWLCLEHPGAWGRDVFAGEAFDPELSAALQRHTEAAGVRLLLIRRPGRAVAAPARRTVLFSRSDPSAAWCERFEVGAPAELLDLDLTPTVAPPGLGTSVTEPVALVCAHGKRDQCCAVLGRPVAATLADRFGDAVWECSHTGGHRFAPSMILLPSGLTYGRLGAEASVESVLAAREGEVYLPGLRGRSCWSPDGQVAEIAVRERVSASDTDLVVEDVVVDGRAAGALVRHRDGRSWEVETTRVELEARPPSCGALAKSVTAVVAAAVTPQHS